jgi:hypothetical protein
METPRAKDYSLKFVAPNVLSADLSRNGFTSDHEALTRAYDGSAFVRVRSRSFVFVGFRWYSKYRDNAAMASRVMASRLFAPGAGGGSR